MTKYYVIQVVGDVEPHVHGPYSTEDERDQKAREIRKECEDDLPDGIYAADVKDGELSVDSYTGGFLEKDQ